MTNREAESLYVEGGGESLTRYNHKEQVLSLAIYLCFEIKVMLDSERISGARLHNVFITAIASQTGTKGQENKSLFLKEGKYRTVRLGHMSKT